MSKLVNYSCRQLTEQKQMGIALKFSFRALAIPRQVFYSRTWWVCTYCAFIKRGPAWLKILSISVSPYCVYQGDLIRVRGPERVWLLSYDISQRPVHAWGWPKAKDPCGEGIHGKAKLLLCIGICQHTQGSLKQHLIGKIMRETI